MDVNKDLQKIKDPVLKQFECFSLNLKEVERLNLISSWPREHQEDFRDLLKDVPRLKNFQRYWRWRKRLNIVFKVYWNWVRSSVQK
jgi:hypothetical protein